MSLIKHAEGIVRSSDRRREKVDFRHAFMAVATPEQVADWYPEHLPAFLQCWWSLSRRERARRYRNQRRRPTRKKVTIHVKALDLLDEVDLVLTHRLPPEQ